MRAGPLPDDTRRNRCNTCLTCLVHRAWAQGHVTVEGGPHNVAWTHPEECNKALDFLGEG